eukprot:tig00021589_g22728.t1
MADILGALEALRGSPAGPEVAKHLQTVAERMEEDPQFLAAESVITRFRIISVLLIMPERNQLWERVLLGLPSFDVLRTLGCQPQLLWQMAEAAGTHHAELLMHVDSLPWAAGEGQLAMAGPFLREVRTRTDAYIGAARLVLEAVQASRLEGPDPVLQARVESLLALTQESLGPYPLPPPLLLRLKQAYTEVRAIAESEENERSQFYAELAARVARLDAALAHALLHLPGPLHAAPEVAPEAPRANGVASGSSLGEGKAVGREGGAAGVTERSESPAVALSARYHPEALGGGVEADALVAVVGEIWLQVDPVLNRLIYHANEQEECLEEIFTSIAPGRLELRGDRVTWTIDQEQARQHAQKAAGEARGGEEATLSLRYSEVNQFTWGRVQSTASFYISFHTRQVFKFFPVYEGEISELTAALTDLTGKEPYMEDAYIEEILHQKLEATRMTVLRELSQSEHSWITHTQDLFQVLKNLTSEDKAQSIYDMERLFHSCRLNKMVTLETINVLKRTWAETMSEAVRVKILAVCERLLDRVVMHASDSNFRALVSWFSRIEGLLDPYRSPQSLKMLLLLRKRGDEIKRQPLTTLTENQIAESFDMLDHFTDFRDKEL